MTEQRPVVNYLNGIIRLIHWLTRVCGVIAALLLAIACLVVCQMIIVRYAMDESTVWQTEFITFCIVGATLIGSPYVLLKRGHVNVDLLSQKLPARPRCLLEISTSVIACIVCGILAWTGWVYFHEAWREEWVTESVWGPPLWIPLLALPLGLGMLTVQYLAEILKLAVNMLLPDTYTEQNEDGQ